MAARRKSKPTRRKRVVRTKRSASRPRAARTGRGRSPSVTRSPRKRSARTTARHATAAVRGLGSALPHLDYTTHDLEAVRRFYAETLGFASTYDSGHEYLTVHLSKTSTLGFMAPAPGPPEQWRPPREPALYFLVADVDAAHARLVAQGVSFEQPPSDMPWGHRAAWMRDPEGRMVWIATARAK